MKFQFIKIIMISIVFTLFSSMAHALEYQKWIPLLPESIGGLERSGEPSGANMEQRGQEWAALEQEYADDKGTDLKLRIVSGPTAPGIKEFNTMKQFTVNTPQREVKTLEISGYTAVLDLSKTGGESNLITGVHDETLVVISTSSYESERDIISLVDDVPLSDIADSMN